MGGAFALVPSGRKGPGPRFGETRRNSPITGYAKSACFKGFSWFRRVSPKTKIQTCGPDAPNAGVKSCGGSFGSTGLDKTLIRKATVAKVHGSPGRSRYKP